MPGQVYAVASGKGGVGKTTTAVNLGVTLRADGHSVVLVDADLGMPNLADFLGIEPDGTIHDVLAGNAAVDDVVTAVAEGFAVIPGDRDLAGFAHADPDALDAVIEAAAAEYDYVIVDTGAGLSYEDVLPLGLVDEVILVTTPDPAAVGDTAKTVELAGLVDGAIAGVVVTRVRDGEDPESIADRLGVDLLAAIPFDDAVQESTATGSPLEAHAPASAAAGAYRGLEATLTDGEPPTAGQPTRSAGTAESDADGLGSPDRGGDSDGTAAAGDASTPDDEPGGHGDDEGSDPEEEPAVTDETPDDSLGAVPDDDDPPGEVASNGTHPDPAAEADPTEVDDAPDTETTDDLSDTTGDETAEAAAPGSAADAAPDEGDDDTATDADDAARKGPLARFLGWFR